MEPISTIKRFTPDAHDWREGRDMYVSRLNRLRAAVAMQMAGAGSTALGDRARYLSLSHHWTALADAKDAGMATYSPARERRLRTTWKRWTDRVR
jgi:hypothetical protein